MKSLLAFAGLVDRVNQRVCLIATWLVLLACLVSAGNAASATRSTSARTPGSSCSGTCSPASSCWAPPYTLKLNEHVRVDVLYARFTPRTAAWIDLLGSILFLMPAAG